jgi:hypothetical protein
LSPGDSCRCHPLTHPSHLTSAAAQVTTAPTVTAAPPHQGDPGQARRTVTPPRSSFHDLRTVLSIFVPRASTILVFHHELLPNALFPVCAAPPPPGTFARLPAHLRYSTAAGDVRMPSSSAVLRRRRGRPRVFQLQGRCRPRQ